MCRLLMLRPANEPLRCSNLYHNRLRQLPERLFIWPPGPQFLLLVGNLLTALPPRLLENATALVHVNLINNAVSAIPPLFFRPARLLQSLFLKSNALTLLDPDLFLTNTRLTVLCVRPAGRVFRFALDSRLDYLGVARTLGENFLTNVPARLLMPLNRSLSLWTFHDNLLTEIPLRIKNFARLSTLCDPRAPVELLVLAPAEITDPLITQDFCQQPDRTYPARPL